MAPCEVNCYRQQMADQQNRQVRGAIIGAVVVQFLGANGAGVGNFKIAIKQVTLAAAWAFAA
jgi:hypothetical protein